MVRGSQRNLDEPLSRCGPRFVAAAVTILTKLKHGAFAIFYQTDIKVETMQKRLASRISNVVVADTITRPLHCG